MALRPYQRQEQINASAPRVDFSGAEIADPGQVFRQTSRSLLQAVEPIMEKRAAEAGTRDGAKAPLIRDEDGQLRRAPLPRGGGLVYGEAYKNAMNTIYKGRLMFDAEAEFENIRTRNEDNPEQMLVEMRAHAEAVAETIPDDIRAEIEPHLFREAIQRFNGANIAKINRDNRNALDELGQQYRGLEKKLYGDLTRLAQQEDWDAYDATLKDGMARLDQNQAARKGIAGGLTGTGEEGEDAAFLDNLADIDLEVTSTKSVLALTRNAKELVQDRQALELIVAWRLGDDSNGEGRVMNMSYADWVNYIPTQRGREKAAQWATDQIQALDRLAAEAAARANDAEKEESDQTKREAIAVLGEMALANDDYFKLWDADFNRTVLAQHPNITSFLLDPKNRDWTVAQVGFGGKLPTALKQFIIDQAAGTNAHLVLDITEKMMGTRSDKTKIYTGIKAWRDLPDDTRAVITRYRELSDMEVPTEQRRAILNDIVTGKWRVRSAAGAFKDEDGKPSVKLYQETRDKYVRAIFGTDPKKLPAKVAEDIESSVKSFLAVYGEDRDTAVRKAVEGVATLWSPHPIGQGGYLPTELKGLELTANQLNDAFGLVKNGKIVAPGGSLFTTTTREIGGIKLPRARLSLMDDSQLPAGVGNYRIDFYDIDGNWVGVQENINIDARLAAHYGSQAAYQKKLREARIQTAKTTRARYQAALKKAADQKPKVRPMRGRDY